MPRYDFQCACGVRFEKALPMSVREDPQTCPDCGEQAPRHMPEDVAGAFNQQAVGMGPQNTGVHDFDTFTDRVIGDHARQGWETIQQRQEKKAEVLAGHPDKTPRDLSRTPDGSYEVLPGDARAVQERALEIDRLAMEDRKNKLKKESGGSDPR